jgi:hypothetical protein
VKSPNAGFLHLWQVFAFEQIAQPGKVNSHFLHTPAALAYD